jgi:hypothetical protein
MFQLRHAVAGLLALLIVAGAAVAADKEIKGKVVKVDLKKKTLAIMTEEGKKVYTISDETKFIGPKGGISDAGLKDDRLTEGAEITVVVAGNNKTVREVHLPERKGANKDK